MAINLDPRASNTDSSKAYEDFSKSAELLSNTITGIFQPSTSAFDQSAQTLLMFSGAFFKSIQFHISGLLTAFREFEKSVNKLTKNKNADKNANLPQLTKKLGDEVGGLLKNIKNSITKAPQQQNAAPSGIGAMMKNFGKSISGSFASVFKSIGPQIGSRLAGFIAGPIVGVVTSVFMRAGTFLIKAFEPVGDVIKNSMIVLNEQIDLSAKSFGQSLIKLKALDAGFVAVSLKTKSLSLAIDASKIGFLTISKMANVAGAAIASTANMIMEAFTDPINALPKLGKSIANFVQYFDPTAVARFNQVFRDLNAVIGAILKPALDAVSKAMRMLADYLLSQLPTLLPIIQQLSDKFVELFADNLPNVIATLMTFGEMLSETMMTIFNSFNSATEGIKSFTYVIDLLLDVFDSLVLGISLVAATFMGPIFGSIVAVVGILDYFEEAIGIAYETMVGWVANLTSYLGFDTLSKYIRSFSDAVGQATKWIFDKLKFLNPLTWFAGETTDALRNVTKATDEFANKLDANKKKLQINRPQAGGSIGFSAPTQASFSGISDVSKEAAKRAFESSGKGGAELFQKKANEVLINILPKVAEGILNWPQMLVNGLNQLENAKQVPVPQQQGGNQGGLGAGIQGLAGMAGNLFAGLK